MFKSKNTKWLEMPKNLPGPGTMYLLYSPLVGPTKSFSHFLPSCLAAPSKALVSISIVELINVSNWEILVYYLCYRNVFFCAADRVQFSQTTCGEPALRTNITDSVVPSRNVQQRYALRWAINLSHTYCFYRFHFSSTCLNWGLKRLCV